LERRGRSKEITEDGRIRKWELYGVEEEKEEEEGEKRRVIMTLGKIGRRKNGEMYASDKKRKRVSRRKG